MFLLDDKNHSDNVKRFKAWRHYLTKAIMKNYNFIINGKNFHDQPTDSDTKWYKKIKLTAEQGEGYTTACLFDYEYINKNCRLIEIYLGRQKELKGNSGNRIFWEI